MTLDKCELDLAWTVGVDHWMTTFAGSHPNRATPDVKYSIELIRDDHPLDSTISYPRTISMRDAILEYRKERENG